MNRYELNRKTKLRAILKISPFKQQTKTQKTNYKFSIIFLELHYYYYKISNKKKMIIQNINTTQKR